MKWFSHLAAIGVFVLSTLWATAPASAQGQRGKVKIDEIAALTTSLHGTNQDEAIRAAAGLGANKDPKALDALLDALALGLHPAVAAAALDAVAAHGQERSLDTVAFFLSYRDPAVRAAAMRALAPIQDRRTVRYVMLGLRDGDKAVRAVAIGIATARDLRAAIEPMLELIKKGEEATVPALVAMGSPDVAQALGELIGEAPAPLLARALGGMLAREDFEPEAARVQVVRALGKIPGNESILALRAYVDSLPEDSIRQSRREAKALIKELTTPIPRPAGEKK